MQLLEKYKENFDVSSEGPSFEVFLVFFKLLHLYQSVAPLTSCVHYDVFDVTLSQAFSQKGVQASWDAPRTKSGRLWTPKFWGESEIIFNYFPKYINISERK
jgi:hypothetical protein